MIKHDLICGEKSAIERETCEESETKSEIAHKAKKTSQQDENSIKTIKPIIQTHKPLNQHQKPTTQAQNQLLKHSKPYAIRHR